MDTDSSRAMGEGDEARPGRPRGGMPDLGTLPPPVLALGGLAVSTPFLIAEGAAGTYLPGHPFILVLPAVLAASVLFRWQGGMAALIASAVYVDMAHLSPVGTLAIGSPAAAIAFAVFVGIGLYVVAVISSLQAAMTRQGRLLREVEHARDRSAAAERDKAVLIDELDHRIRNAIASVASVATHTLRSSASLEEFGPSFERRIAALTRTHDLIARGETGSGVGLRDLLTGEFEPFAGTVPCDLDGPEITLGPRTALKMSLVFHELATNAAKYGGLSRDGLGMRVAWRKDGDDTLEIDWRERLGVPREASDRRGSGSRLLDHTVRGVGGQVRTDPDPSGYGIAIGLPIGALAE